MSDFEIQTVDGMYIRQEVIPARTMQRMHAHQHAHATLLARGRIILWSEDRPQQMVSAPAVLNIPAGIQHGYQALGEDVLIYCLHNLHGLKEVGLLDAEDLVDV